MSNGTINNNSSSNSTSTSATTQTTSQLPGVNVADVKPSSPQMVKENFQAQVEKKNGSSNKK